MATGNPGDPGPRYIDPELEGLRDDPDVTGSIYVLAWPASTTDALLNQMRANGANDVDQVGFKSVRARVPKSKLNHILELPEIDSISPERPVVEFDKGN